MLLAEVARRLAGQQQAVVRVDQRRHQREVHQQDLHEQRRAAEEGDVGRSVTQRAASSHQASGALAAAARRRELLTRPSSDAEHQPGADGDQVSSIVIHRPLHEQRPVAGEDLPAQIHRRLCAC